MFWSILEDIFFSITICYYTMVKFTIDMFSFFSLFNISKYYAEMIRFYIYWKYIVTILRIVTFILSEKEILSYHRARSGDDVTGTIASGTHLLTSLVTVESKCSVVTSCICKQLDRWYSMFFTTCDMKHHS